MIVKVVDSNFIKSAVSIRDAVAEDIAEVVFVGRSNVGKSSLLNSLTSRKGLAKSSSTPGKTRLINFFDVLYRVEEKDFKLRFVDLPGFGYAKASKTIQEEWKAHLHEFLQKRNAIKLFILLRDSRHPSLEIDNEARAFIQSIQRPDQEVMTVFTKTDKLKQKDVALLKREFSNPMFVSNLNKIGVANLKVKIIETLFHHE
jgi:GTP-binding protein